jgi:hypothetical protein
MTDVARHIIEHEIVSATPPTAPRDIEPEPETALGRASG